MNKYSKIMTSLLFFLALFVGAGAIGQTNEVSNRSKGIKFMHGNWKDILAKAKKSGKYIFVDAYTSWCGPCKLLKSKTFVEDKATVYFNDHFINYTVDMEKGEGPKLAAQWEVTAYPTLLFFSPDGKLLMRQVGFVNGDRLVAFGKQAKTKK
ncbi:MAG: thioredoxin family protein [Sphingobacterium sp.]